MYDWDTWKYTVVIGEGNELVRRFIQPVMKMLLHNFLNSLISYGGVRSKCPQNVPPWHADYFELKSVKAPKQEEFCTSPFLKEIQIEKDLQEGKPGMSQEGSKRLY